MELLLRDGRKISIDCTGVEDALDVTMAQRSELDYLIYNDPLSYACLLYTSTTTEQFAPQAEPYPEMLANFADAILHGTPLTAPGAVSYTHLVTRDDQKWPPLVLWPSLEE